MQMVIKKIELSFLILFTFTLFGWTGQLEMKSVTVAGFINKGKTNQDNINKIMTKSLCTFLSKISKNITPYKDVEEVALKNSFWNQKELKSSQAINIAQPFSTEQVITGDYIVNDKNETISIQVFVYNVVSGQLLFQRNYKGSAGPDIFDTIDKMILDVSGLLVGKPIQLGYAKISIKPVNENYKLFVNDVFVKLISSKDGYFDNFISGQSVDILLKTETADKEVMKKKLEIQSGKTNELVYNPSGVLIVETMESSLDVNMNGIFIGKTDGSGELKIPDVLAGKPNMITVKNSTGTVSETNIAINEGDIKVVVFKTALQNNNTPSADKEPRPDPKNLPWFQRPWYNRFTVGLSFGLKFLNGNANSDFYSKLGTNISGLSKGINTDQYFTMEVSLLYRAFNHMAVGAFLGFPLGGGSKTGLDMEMSSVGVILRFIPFSFLTGETESMLYIDLKSGVGVLGGPGVTSGLFDKSGKQIDSFNSEQIFKSPYFSVGAGGVWGLGPVQLGLSAVYEFCNIEQIKSSSSGKILNDSDNNIIRFDSGGFVFKTDINLNF
jgi:hypothetical protein